MIELTPEFSKEAFKGLFVRGALFHCQNYDFWNGSTKDKFVLLLNGCDSSSNCHFMLPTSQVEKRKKNPILSKALYIFPSGSISTFTEETGIIVSDIYSKAYTYFEQKYIDHSVSKGILTFCENVSEAVMEDIDKLIMANNDIALNVKMEVLPSKYVSKP